MEKWETAVESFLQKWRERDDVEGVMVCGSYVTGSQSKRSDIDLHIIMSSGVDWRMRGNEIVDGILIEYFVNPPEQFPEYFKEDYDTYRRHAAHMFVSGKILLDKNGLVAKLQEEAVEWMTKEFPELSPTTMEIEKYVLWDTLDNLQDAYETGSASFTYTYWSSLKTAFEFYSKYLRFEVIPTHKIHEQLNDEAVQKKYYIQPYPDKMFKDMMNNAISVAEKVEMLERFKEIVEYIHGKLGGFALDGWSLKTKTTY